MVILAKDTAPVAAAVLAGLARKPKQLPSWLFYDEQGDAIFQSIMRLPEYYPTRCEYEIFQRQKESIRQQFTAAGTPFRLVELGAGDGLKTELLLKHFLDQGTDFEYWPTDISPNVLDILHDRLEQSLPALTINPIAQRHEDALRTVAEDREHRHIFMFLGANIGNYSLLEAQTFVNNLAAAMHSGDLLFMGFDLKKDPRVIQAAYDDPHGVTRSFNLNVLTRLNRELGANFDIDAFDHAPYYDPESGAAKSYLVSLRSQDVHIEATHQKIHFDAWETIHTEVSLKYDVATIETLARKANLEIVRHFADPRDYFRDILFRKP
jgi:L-histidine Nalpha-methyltransferase